MPDTSTPVTTEELQAAFRKSRLYFQNIGFLRAMEIPALRMSLQLYAIHLRKPEGLIKPNAAELFSQKVFDLVSAATKCAVALDDLRSKSYFTKHLTKELSAEIENILEETHDACKAMGYPYCDEDTGNPPNKITDHFQWRTTGTPDWSDEGKTVEIKTYICEHIVGKLKIQHITFEGEDEEVPIFVLVKDDGTKHAFTDNVCWRFVYQDTEDEIERARRLVGSGAGADK